MRTTCAFILACACFGCSRQQGGQQAAQPTVPATHPFAENVVAHVTLKDGKNYTGRVTWDAATREYRVAGLSWLKEPMKIPADQVARIWMGRSSIAMLQPTNEVLRGTVKVLVRVAPRTTNLYGSALFATIGGHPGVRPRAQLKRVGRTDQWTGKLDSTQVPNGSNTLTVFGWTVERRKLTGDIPVFVGNPLKCFFAGIHGHTGYTSGTLFPSDAFSYARHVSRLDVFALSDHLAAITDEEWMDMREMVYKANEDGAFVTIPGLSWWSPQGGHAVILDPGSLSWPTDVAGFYEAAAKTGVIAKFSGPGDGKVVFGGLAYSAVGDKAIELMEVRSPIEEQAYIRALNQGWHLAPDGSADTYKPIWGNQSWTGIWAPSLTRRNIWAALKARHCYSTTDRNCQLSFSINGAVMGDITAEPAKTLSVEIVVDDPDRKDAVAKVELFEDGVVAQTKEPSSGKCSWQPSCSPKTGNHYYFVKVTQTDSNTLWSAPIWVNKVAE